MPADNCPFCNTTDRVLLDNDHAKVILSNPHKVPGHLLVMPKRHVEKPWELIHDEITDIFDLIFVIEQKILGKLGEGVDIRQNYRPFITQDELKVDHLVFHVIPRSPDDYLYNVSEQYETELFADLDEAEAKAVADLLKD
jgi:histidine triad (HIT) family protein